MKTRFLVIFVLTTLCAVSAVVFSPSLTRAATGDYCRAPGNIPGHLNSSGHCIPDEMVGQSCGQNMYYDSNRDCVSECQIKKVGGICDADGKAGHCDSSLRCVADPISPGPQTPGSNTPQTPGSNTPQTPGVNTGSNVTLLNPLGPSGTSLEAFLNSILDFVIRIGAIVVILMLVYIGFLFVTARDDTTKISAARQALLWTVVGALILLGAKAIAIGIQATVQALSVGR